MRPIFIIFFLACVLSACAAPLLAATPFPPVEVVPLTGEWLGGFVQADGTVVSLLINFVDSAGSLNIQPLIKSWDLSDLVQDGEQVTFSVLGKTYDPFVEIHFAGQSSNGSIAGNLDWNGNQYPVEFSALAQDDSASFEKYVGVYRFDSGEIVSVLLCPAYDDGRLQYFPPGLMFTDLVTGDSRGLYPLRDSKFGIGSARVLAYPLEDKQIQFMTNDSGEVTGLQSIDASGTTKLEIASRINYSVEDVKFTSEDGAVMAGLLTSPETLNPHPAFMMLHGSEAGIKDGFGQQILAHYMVSQGIALLTYDKRGVGDSEGVYRESADTSNIKLIASDAVAGADYLSRRPEVTPDQIGLIGGSQAGWVIPVAAAQSENVDFLVIFSGPVVSFAQEDHYSTITNDGESAAIYDAEKLDQALRGMNPVGAPITGIVDLTQPGLWLWGSVDKNVPFKVSAENLQALIDSGKSNFSYAILPNGDHNLNESAHGYFAEIPYSPRVLYFSKLTEWLEQNNLAQGNVSAKTPVTSNLDIGSIKVSEKDGMKLLYIPAGEFTMGSESGEENEKPVHMVFLDSFWIDQTEITNGMYALCVHHGKCDVPGSKESLTRRSYYGEVKYKNYPVIFVDWNMAKIYCEWTGRYLPTEAEWEKAARGTEAFAYPWGNTVPNNNLLNYKDVIGDVTEVGIYPDGASPYGALDMAGNVWEWVNDWFDPEYYQNSPELNPLGPSTGRTHVLRGGSWNLNEDLVQTTYRGTHPSEPNLGIGFRCAMDTKE